MTDPMEAEFDVAATWAGEAVRELGAEHAIPAACQGSASPAALEWLGSACDIDAGTRLLDVGGGIGGPAAYAVQRWSAHPLLVDPMPGACRTARDLFGLPAVVGAGESLPVATGAVSAVWCLGVLCTTPRRPDVLRELRRVLRADGALGLLVFVRRAARLPDVPEGNDFPDPDELVDQIRAAGLVVAGRVGLDELAPAPSSWAVSAEEVQAVVARDHAADPRYRRAQDQQDRIARLLREGAVSGLLLHARPGQSVSAARS